MTMIYRIKMHLTWSRGFADIFIAHGQHGYKFASLSVHHLNKAIKLMEQVVNELEEI